MATDEDIYSRIKSLVDEEHSLTGSSDAADGRSPAIALSEEEVTYLRSQRLAQLAAWIR